MAAETFRKKKTTTKSRLFRRFFFFFFFFNVYTNVDNRERPGASYWKQRNQFRKKKNMEHQSGGEKMTNTSDQQGENAWVAVKNKSEHEHRKQNIG